MPTTVLAAALWLLGAAVMCVAACFGLLGLLGMFVAEGADRWVCVGCFFGSPIVAVIGILLCAAASALGSAIIGFVARFTRSMRRTIAD